MSFMGIQDRDYYRRATAGSLWLTGTTPVTIGLVVTNVCVFLAIHFAPFGPDLQNILELVPSRVFQNLELWRLLTATFCHAPGIWHILMNMLFLWWFGRELEALYGSREFLLFYLVAAVFSSLAWALASWLAEVDVPMIGASGAVTAVTVLYTLYNPRHVMHIWGVVPIEMRWLVIIYLGIDALGLVRGPGYSPVAHLAHLAGAAYALVFQWGDLRASRLFVRRSIRPRLRVVSPEPEPEAASSLDERLEHQMDLILAKISREGAESLTDSEREVLQRASRQLRSRRS
jgi:membrane associated rhomboid family serine protease